MNGNERRNRIRTILKESDRPVSGTSLSKQLNVSRQVIVQDIALLRANGTQIISTNHGYVLSEREHMQRVYKVRHTNEEVEEELNIIVDLGGKVENVFVNHKVYGVVKADMGIRSRKDVREYVQKIKSGASSFLMNTTSGYHYHTVTADSEETLEQIFCALQKRGFLADLQDYEPADFWMRYKE